MTKNNKTLQLIRYDKNPILTPTNYWWENKAVFNPAVCIIENKICLLYRAMGNIPVSNFGLAELSNPFTVKTRLHIPIMNARENITERLGIEDARITPIHNHLHIIYVGVSLNFKRKKPHPWSKSGTPWRIRILSATTKNFSSIIHHGIIMPNIDTKDATLFPKKINGKYALLHRPFPEIWISYSSSTKKFTKGKFLAGPRKEMWDNDRIGAGSPPIKTPLGWLIFYHGVNKKADGQYHYMLGVLLLDLNNPEKILYRSDKPILQPEKPYEKKGLVNNVVFTCGAIEWEDKYYVYYGAADTVTGVAYIDKKQLLQHIESHI